MSINDWNVLTVLAQTQNITKAAEHLYISQPALSYRLRQIEEEFGVPIFDRVPTGIIPTPQGERVIAYAQQMQTIYEKLLEDISEMNSSVSGTLRLGVCNTFANSDLPGLLLAFRQKYPMIQINLRADLSKNIYLNLVNGDVGIAILRGEWQWSEERALLREEPVYLVSYKEIDLKELPRLPQILSPTAAIYSGSMRWWKENFSVPPLVQMEVNSVETGIHMVERELGWMMVPELSLKNISKSTNLFRMPIIYKDGSLLTRETWILSRNSAKHLHIASAFIDFIVKMESTSC